MFNSLTTAIKTHQCKIQIMANHLNCSNYPPEPWLSFILPCLNSFLSKPPSDTWGAERWSKQNLCHDNSLLPIHKIINDITQDWKRNTNQITLGPTTMERMLQEVQLRNRIHPTPSKRLLDKFFMQLRFWQSDIHNSNITTVTMTLTLYTNS